MIPASPKLLQPEHWQTALANSISDPAELLEQLQLPQSLLADAQRSAALFPLKVTHHFAGLMKPGDIADPLLQQVLPLAAEQETVEGYVEDPVGDQQAALGAGILQKYAARALLVTTGACAVHCRYCFRRNYPYGAENALRHWPQAIDILRSRSDLREVILSGGDPLSLSDTRLESMLDELEAIPHLRILRIHTRLPVVLPQRVTSALSQRLQVSRFSVVLVLHVNHPQELSPSLAEAVTLLRGAAVTVLNQSVLLAGVNDCANTLQQLSERLFEIGVLPYYLHQLDPVRGAAHFQVPEQRAIDLLERLRNVLPGYLVPRLVREIAGQPCKMPLQFS